MDGTRIPMKNTPEDEAVERRAYDVTAAELRSFVERVERLTVEVDGLKRDIKEVFLEAKGRGYSPAPLRKIIAIRAKDMDAYAEEKALVELYAKALGMEV